MDVEMNQRVVRGRQGETRRAPPSPLAAGVLITDKVLAVLVDGVVCEVHAHVILEREEEERREDYNPCVQTKVFKKT